MAQPNTGRIIHMYTIRVENLDPSSVEEAIQDLNESGIPGTSEGYEGGPKTMVILETDSQDHAVEFICYFGRCDYFDWDRE